MPPPQRASKWRIPSILLWAVIPGCALLTWTVGLMVIVRTCGGGESAEVSTFTPRRVWDSLFSQRRQVRYSAETIHVARQILAAQSAEEFNSDTEALVQKLAALVIDNTINADSLRKQPPDKLKERSASAGVQGANVDELQQTVAAAVQQPPEVYTQAECYFASDESQLCHFKGPICFDGQGPVAFVQKPIRKTDASGNVVSVNYDDYTGMCVDPRYYEPSGLEDSGCSIITAGERRSYDVSRPIDPATGFSMGLRYNRWGPSGRNGGLFWREERPEDVFGKDAARTLKAAMEGSFADVSEDLGVVADAPYAHPVVPGLRFAGRTNSSSGIQVEWLEHPLWLAGLDGQWDTNPFHWWSKIGALFDARRSNATVSFLDHPDDGYVQVLNREHIPGKMGILREWRRELGFPADQFSRANRMRYRVGPQWGPLPSMRHVFFTGDGAKTIQHKGQLADWFKSTMELATPPGTVHTFNDLLSTLGPSKMVCSATGGVIPGSKAKWFTGRGDAWMWRQYAYQATGLSEKGVKPHPLYPPRKITFVDRKGMNGRGVYNRDAVIDAIAATGLPYHVVPSMGTLTFAQQVELMSGTGILIAPHGAALANAMFLPAHSVVVEMFPYGMKKNTYRHLASMADLSYFPLHSWELLPFTDENAKAFYGVQLMREDYYWSKCAAVNISSMDALNEHACNAASKNYPIVVDIHSLQGVLRDAMDITGAFSLRNPSWAQEAERLGIKPAARPAHVQPAKAPAKGV